MPLLSQYRETLGNDEKETSVNVFTTWELSFQQLQSQASANDLEAKLLTLFAFFDNTDISEELFTELNAIKKKAPESAKLLIWLKAFTKGTSNQWDSESFGEVLVTLRDLSLFQELRKKPTDFTIHPYIPSLETGFDYERVNSLVKKTPIWQPRFYAERY